MADIKHIPVNAPADAITNEIEQNGAVIVDGFLSAEVLATFNAEIDPALAKKSNGHGHPNQSVEFFHGAQTKHLTGVAGVSDTFVNDVLLHPAYKTVGDAFLLPNCSEYILNIAHVLDRGPGAGDQLIHRDQDVWPRKLTAAIGGHVQFASLLALSEYTAEMGATRVVPGSRNWPIDREPKPEVVPLRKCSRGQLSFTSVRPCMAPGRIKQIESGAACTPAFALAGFVPTKIAIYLPLARAGKMPRRAQELLGFGVHDGIANGEGFLGSVDNRIPADMMAAGEI